MCLYGGSAGGSDEIKAESWCIFVFRVDVVPRQTAAEEACVTLEGGGSGEASREQPTSLCSFLEEGGQ